HSVEQLEKNWRQRSGCPEDFPTRPPPLPRDRPRLTLVSEAPMPLQAEPAYLGPRRAPCAYRDTPPRSGSGSLSSIALVPRVEATPGHAPGTRAPHAAHMAATPPRAVRLALVALG